MAIFGLVSTETYDSERFKNIRRSVQYQYPQGAFPLTGLLSIADSEETNDPQFSHWEKRWQLPRTTSASMGSSKGPLKTDADAEGGAAQTVTAGSEYILCVASADHFRLGKVFLTQFTTGATAKTELRGVVTAITARTGVQRVKFRALNTVANIDNGTTNENVGEAVLIIGTAFAQGRENVTGEKFNKPVEFYNYTQIFRSPFMLTGTAMKAPLRYDVKGPHQDKSKETAVEHMVDIEHAILFGTRAKYIDSTVDADPATGAGLPLTTLGGIIYYLNRWEAGDYGTVSVADDDADDKRIIENTTGQIDEDTFDSWMERLFRVTNNTSNEKLCVCGSGALKTLNQLWRSKANLNTDIPMKSTYGMKMSQMMTPWGDVYFKTHPLFNRNPELRHAMLFLDVKNMKLRPMKDRDTKVLTNRQPNDADYRKDEWFTEIGFEMWFPESHMYVKNVRSYVP